MWLIAIVAVLLIGGLVIRALTTDHATPYERHERALAALRDIAEQPQPVVRDVEDHGEMPQEFIHILDDAPTGTSRSRRTASRRAAPARRRASARSSRARRATAGADGPVADLAPPIIHIDSVGRDVTPGASPNVAAAPMEVAAPALRHVDAHVRAGLIAAVSVAAVVGVAFGTFVAIGRSHTPSRRAGSGAPPVAASVTTTTIPVVKVVEPIARVSTLASGDAAVAVASPFTLSLRATGNCWVLVSDASGRTLFTGTLHANQTQDVAAGGSLAVRLGNTPAIGLAVNGQRLDLGGIAKTATVRFSQPA